MNLLAADDDTLRDRMERSPELLVPEVRRLQAEVRRLLSIEHRGRELLDATPQGKPLSINSSIRLTALHILGES